MHTIALKPATLSFVPQVQELHLNIISVFILSFLDFVACEMKLRSTVGLLSLQA